MRFKWEIVCERGGCCYSKWMLLDIMCDDLHSETTFRKDNETKQKAMPSEGEREREEKK